MAWKAEGRLRYDQRTDSFVYEILGSDGNWGLCMSSPCVRREGAEEGEETNYVHFELLKKIVFDADVLGTKLHLG